jgi:hypothetical protein
MLVLEETVESNSFFDSSMRLKAVLEKTMEAGCHLTSCIVFSWVDMPWDSKRTRGFSSYDETVVQRVGL